MFERIGFLANIKTQVANYYIYSMIIPFYRINDGCEFSNTSIVCIIHREAILNLFIINDDLPHLDTQPLD